MNKIQNAALVVVGVALFGLGAMVRVGQPVVQAQAVPPAAVAAGEAEARQLVLLMDVDQNGKVSHKEYMDFMEAEFQRLDLDHDGELNVKELMQSQLVQSRHGGSHR